MICIVILAAGQARRMRGGDKLLEDVDGAPCLSVLTRRALETGFALRVVVPDVNHPRAKAAEGAVLVPSPEAKRGMAHSLRAGLAALPENTKAVIILPGDMPEITAEDMMSVAQAHQTTGKGIIQMGTEDGNPGHPVLITSQYIDEFQHLIGDTGAREIIKAHRDDWHLLKRGGQRARRDLDTPEDWAAWRLKQSSQART